MNHDADAMTTEQRTFELTEDQAWVVENALYQYAEWAAEAIADDEAYAEDRDAAYDLMGQIQKAFGDKRTR